MNMIPATGAPGSLIRRIQENPTIGADLFVALAAMLRLVDGLPWHVRDSVYREFNARTGGLPGSLPGPIAEARAAIANAKGA